MKSSFYEFSRILSFILHPLLIPTIVLSALMLRPELYYIVIPYSLKLRYISMIFIFTLVIPASSVFILLRLNTIYSIEMNLRTERTIPLLIASSSYMALLYFIRSTNIPPIFLYVLYSATFALIAGLLVNMVYKISLHTLGWGTLVATLIGISIRLGTPLLSFIIISILLSGLAGYARLHQNAHNQAQVYSGYVAGICIVLMIALVS